MGAYQTWANANVSNLQDQITGANASIQIIDANIGSYQTYANATFGYGNVEMLANLAGPDAVTFGGNITVNGNVNLGGDFVVANTQAFGIGYCGPLTSLAIINRGADLANIYQTGNPWGNYQNNRITIGSYDSSADLYNGVPHVLDSCSGYQSIQIGTNAGAVGAGCEAVAIGYNAAEFGQSAYATAVGRYAGLDYQGSGATAIGSRAGQGSCGCCMAYNVTTVTASDVAAYTITVADASNIYVGSRLFVNVSGLTSGTTVTFVSGYDVYVDNASWTDPITPGTEIVISQGQGSNATAVGRYAAYQRQGCGAVALGYQAGYDTQKSGAIAIGTYAGGCCQGVQSVAIGVSAGGNYQGNLAIAIGTAAGVCTQGTESVAIGSNSGRCTQGTESVAIGSCSGRCTQGNLAVAIGAGAGATYQSANAVAIGSNTAAGTTYCTTVVSSSHVCYPYTITVGDVTGIQVGSRIIINHPGLCSAIGGGIVEYVDHTTCQVWLGCSCWTDPIPAGTPVIISDGQGPNSIAVGKCAAGIRQGSDAVAIGSQAGATDQRPSSVAIGNKAGQLHQSYNSVAVGVNAGRLHQACDAVAIGRDAGKGTCSYCEPPVIATTLILGSNYNCGTNSNLLVSSTVGINVGAQLLIEYPNLNYGGLTVVGISGYEVTVTGHSWTDPIPACTPATITNGQGYAAVAIGSGSGKIRQGDYTVAVGYGAGNYDQKSQSVAIGYGAAEINQGECTIAVGTFAGVYYQGNSAVAVGVSAGNCCQGDYTVAIGVNAGHTNQGIQSVAIGSCAGQIHQGNLSVAIGRWAACYQQGNSAVAIGACAGVSNQGDYAVAIGTLAGAYYQAANSIAINTGTTALNPTEAGFYVNPIRQVDAANIVVYDPDTKELTYTNNITGPVSMANVITTDGFFWANGVNYSSGIGSGSFAGGAVAATVYPTANLALDLGTTTAYWNNTYTGNLISNALVTTEAVINSNLFVRSNVTLDGGYIQNIADPLTAQDAATKNYVDSALSGISATTISNGSASVSTIDDGGFGNVIVAGNLIIDVTGDVSANIGTLFAGNLSTNANLGAYQTWANANVSNLQDQITGANTDIQTTSANLGAYQTFANANVSAIQANLGSTQIWANANIAELRANLGSTQIWANANIAELRANLGSTQIWANANIQTISANLGAYQTFANANAVSQQNQITGANTNIQTTSANLGAFEAYANTKIGTNSNSNLVVISTTESDSITTGALVVAGGVGVGGNLYVGGNLIVSNVSYEYREVISTTELVQGNIVAASSTASTSNVTGALVVTGGAGISGNVYLGNKLGFVWGANNVSAVYQVFNPVTNSLDTIFG